MGFRLRRRKHDEFLDRDEMWKELDRRAGILLGISAEEFLARLRAGTLPESSAVEHLKILAGEPAR